MAEFPILPLHVSALLGDTYHMDAAEFGAYCRILFTMWLNGGTLMLKDCEKISGLSRYNFRKSSEKIFRPLTIVDGVVSQKRLEDTRLKLREKRAKSAASANVRWARKNGYERNADAMRTHMRTACEIDAIKISKKERVPTDSSEQRVTPVAETAQAPDVQPQGAADDGAGGEAVPKGNGSRYQTAVERKQELSPSEELVALMRRSGRWG